MTCRMLVFMVLAGCMAAFVIGCASGPAIIVAKTRQTVPLSLDENRSTVATKVAEEITLLLPPTQPHPGHRWVLALHDSRMLQQRSEIEPSAAADGRASIRFVAQRPVNRTMLRFLLVPDSEARAVEPIAMHEVVVSIQPDG
jgi:hypothetical protein